MIGVTIGIGKEWFECAHWAARRMEDMTGLECRVVESSCYFQGGNLHPSWWKHRIRELHRSDDGDYLYFDADIIPLKPWNPKEIFEKNGRKLCAVPDNNVLMCSQVRAEEKAIGIPPNTYLNAGLFIFGREHATVFEETWSRRPKFHRWIDQSAWNGALFDLKTRVAVLPKKFNEMTHAEPHTINFHVHSLEGDLSRLVWWQNFFTPAGACKSQRASVEPKT